ncbi:MAG: helix-turn-helix transcriptional regulator [Proteobacteria bacterium]|nr:helix-turn-helix transcriptional regulator [Pseudomonadota bacterium]
MSAAMTLATNLRAVMAERGLSPEDLARGCAWEHSTVKALLLGEGASTLAHIDRLLAWLDVSLEDLLVGHHLYRQAELLGGRAQLEQYWALPADQRAQVDAFMRGAGRAIGRSRAASRRKGAGQPILSEAERRVVMNF